MTRQECLDAAAKRVLRDRQNEYGQPEDCFGVIAGMWTAYLGKCVSAHDVAAMMVLLKVARFRANPLHADSAVDCAGYASCMAELATAWEREGDDGKDGDAPAFMHGDSMDAVISDAGGGDGRFRDGDPVEVLPIDGEWERATYRYSGTRNGMRGCWVSDPDSFQNLRFVPDCGIRPVQTPKAEGNHPEIPDSSPEFKRGDKVQFKEHLGVKEWADARYEREHPSGNGHIVYAEGFGRIAVEPENLRHAPKAEGCEELVQKEAQAAPEKASRHLWMPPSSCSGEHCGCRCGGAHAPTGEELAELAEEGA